MDQTKTFSVSELSLLLKNTIEKNFSNIKLRGELSGITRASSGHTYLSIKDSDSVINAIIWRGTTVNFDLTDGIEVIVTGKLTIYPARSNYQMIISSIEIAGAGAILKILEERKQKLAKEGLFDESRKKPLPIFPKVIGIITSPTGAALHDILNKLKDRLPAKILLYAAQVQGASAANEVTNGIKYFNSLTIDSASPIPDVIIVARGGGSLEDLLPFSEEIVVRAVAASKIPIISGVGHEPDWMLIDFAADVRAPTPTGAAEIVAPTKESLLSELEKFKRIAKNSFIQFLQNAQMRMDGILVKSPLQILKDHRTKLDDLFHLLNLNIKNNISSLKANLVHSEQLLESMSYKNVLKRGYAIVRHKDKIVSSKNDFKLPASIEFFDGLVTTAQ